MEIREAFTYRTLQEGGGVERPEGVTVEGVGDPLVAVWAVHIDIRAPANAEGEDALSAGRVDGPVPVRYPESRGRCQIAVPHLAPGIPRSNRGDEGG